MTPPITTANPTAARTKAAPGLAATQAEAARVRAVAEGPAAEGAEDLLDCGGTLTPR